MKNKQAEQLAARKAHKERLEAIKVKRRQEPILERADPELVEKPTILIVCEGKNTEPSYFNKFKLSSATIRAVGNGRNTVSLVESAILMRDGFDQVWCVFDKDDFSANDFNNAIQLATGNGLGVAYSNQSFEYWLILHFEDHQGGGMHRNEYDSAINEHIEEYGCEYDGNGSKIITQDFFDLLCSKDPQTDQSRTSLAVARAKRNYNNLQHVSPATEESSTTVFRLVEVILRHL